MASTTVMSPVSLHLSRNLTECARQRRVRMATFPLGHTNLGPQYQQHQHSSRHVWSLNDLSSELLALIFEQLRDIDRHFVATARRLCRRFNDIATPIAYKTLFLNEQIVAHDAELHYPHALEHIYTHTNHVVARSDLDLVGIKRILERIHKLATLRWRYVDADIHYGRFWMPSDVLNPKQTRFDRTKLYIEELPLRDFEGAARNTYLRAIPTELLVSLKLAHPAPPLVTRLGSLKDLVLSARRLEALHFEDRGQGTQFTFYGSERLPAFRELNLRSYDWHHSRDEVLWHWDFSRITSLELVAVPLFNFLSSVSFADFANLHTLHADDFSTHLPDLRQEATSGLYVLIKSFIRSLHTLRITVHTSLFPVDAILSHAHSLTHLRLRDYVGFGEEDRQCPTLWVDDLVLMSRHLRHVHTLELDMDVAYTEPSLFMKALCSFPSLHTLTLHVQTVVHPFDVVYPNTDRDYDASMRMLQFLVSNKEAPALPGRGYRAAVSWKRITINVGGWKKIMVRRLSEAWRRQNQQGVFAERCFVLERNCETGQMNVWEDFPVEASRQEKPEPEAETGYVQDNVEDDE